MTQNGGGGRLWEGLHRRFSLFAGGVVPHLLCEREKWAKISDSAHFCSVRRECGRKTGEFVPLSLCERERWTEISDSAHICSVEKECGRKTEQYGPLLLCMREKWTDLRICVHFWFAGRESGPDQAICVLASK